MMSTSPFGAASEGIVLGFRESAQQGSALAEAIGWPFDLVSVHRFPDGESRVRLPEALPSRVVIVRSLDAPNGKLVELMLAADGARAQGVQHLTLVAPYLCYMRQDAAFEPGEVVSQRVIGSFLARLFDAVVSVDPHLHRVASLAQAVPASIATAVSAAPAMGEFLVGRLGRPLLVGPDEESEQWVKSAAARPGLDYVVGRKTRRGDRKVAITLPEREYRGREAVVVDDVASTGRTLAATARALLAAGASGVDVLVTHALFVGDALQVLTQAGVGQVWSSDSVPHGSNAFSLAPTLAAAVQRVMARAWTH